MALYVTEITTGETDALRDVLFAADMGAPEVMAYQYTSLQAISLTERQVRYLESLDSDTDGHIDSDGTMWIAGTGSPVNILHNA